MIRFFTGRIALGLAAAAMLGAAGCSDLRVPSQGRNSAQPSLGPCDRDAGGPGTVYVCRGDTLLKLAHLKNVTVPNLKRANGLVDETIYAGSTLVLPAETVHVVAPGETLLEISRKTGVSTQDIIAANELTNPDRILPETRLAIPNAASMVASRSAETTVVTHLPPPTADERPQPTWSGAPDNGSIVIGRQEEPQQPSAPPAPKPAEQSPATAPAIEAPTAPVANATPPPHPRERPAGAVAARPIAPAAPKAAVAPKQQKSPTKATFLLPVEGRILSDFGPKSGGLHNDGINIAAPRGTAIRAAAAGEVAYAGDGLPGFGNLILIKHADGWTSAYAHADSVAVKRGDRVTQGQTIGEVGDTGSVNEPQLHFELRQHDRAVDPKKMVR